MSGAASRAGGRDIGAESRAEQHEGQWGGLACVCGVDPLASLGTSLPYVWVIDYSTISAGLFT